MVRQNQEQNLNDAVAVLPALATGLDVNVRFRHPLDFEFTAELAVFDLLDVTLCQRVGGRARARRAREPGRRAARTTSSWSGLSSWRRRRRRMRRRSGSFGRSTRAVCDASKPRTLLRTLRTTSRCVERRRRRRGGRAAARAAGVVSGPPPPDTKTVPSVADQPDVARGGRTALGEVVAEVAAEASDEAGRSSSPREGVEHTQKQKQKGNDAANETPQKTKMTPPLGTPEGRREDARAFLESSAVAADAAFARRARRRQGARRGFLPESTTSPPSSS